jgi:hypothetical protein
MTDPPTTEKRANQQGVYSFIRPLLLITGGFVFGCMVTTGFLYKQKGRSDLTGRSETSASNKEQADLHPSEESDAGSPRRKSPQPARDPVKAIRSVFLNSSLTGREIAFAQMMGEMTPENAMQVRKLFLEFDRSGIKSDNEWRMFWHQWAVIDPKGALNQIVEEAKNPEQGYAAEVMANIFSVWAAVDPASSKQALGGIENHWDFEGSYLGLIRGLRFEDASAFAKESEFEEPAFAAKVAESLADRLLRESNSVESMKAWYETLSGNLKTGALDHVYWRTKVADLDDAAVWMKQNVDKGVHNPRIMGEIALDYKRNDPLKGLDWYMSLPDSEITGSIVTELHDKIDVSSDAYKEWKNKNPKIQKFVSDR